MNKAIQPTGAKGGPNMVPEIKPRTTEPDIIETVIAKGDLSKLSPEERVRYYNSVCNSLGLNPLTQPFEYINLNGRLRLYGTRAAADQLRKIHGVSTKILSQEYRDDTLIIHVQARTSDGREDEDLGVVAFDGKLRGEARANQIMKAITKAKRRVTLSICGLGWLDETEVADIPRDNPHVTEPKDIVDVPAPNDPNGIPPPSAEVKPLPKKDSRDVYQKLEQEMHGIDDPDELKAWGTANRDRIAVLPKDWYDIIRGRFSAHMIELRNRPQTTWLQELDTAYSKCTDAHGILDVALRFSPTKPADQDEDEAREIQRQHMVRLGLEEEPK